ncbi:MAG: histidine phosphatase family protein [Armatimonadetes bacterium]|nr:histidine phosphatase family protein [Armatimonadota bacterium]
MRVFLVRHGQTEWNASGRAQGHSDVGLDEIGHAQSLAAAHRLASTGAQRVYTSDLQRSVHTANPIAEALGVPLTVRDDLRERTFGTLEGAHYTEIRAWFAAECRARNLMEHEIRPDGGESLRDVWHRLAKFQKSLDKIRDSAVVVSHGGTLGLLLARLLRGSVQTARGFRFENASVTEVIRRPDGTWQLLRYADTSHLHEVHDDLGIKA